MILISITKPKPFLTVHAGLGKIASGKSVFSCPSPSSAAVTLLSPRLFFLVCLAGFGGRFRFPSLARDSLRFLRFARMVWLLLPRFLRMVWLLLPRFLGWPSGLRLAFERCVWLLLGVSLVWLLSSGASYHPFPGQPCHPFPGQLCHGPHGPAHAHAHAHAQCPRHWSLEFSFCCCCCLRERSTFAQGTGQPTRPGMGMQIEVEVHTPCMS